MHYLRENYKTQLIKFVKGGVSKNIVADYLERFKVIANAKYKIAKEADIKGVSIRHLVSWRHLLIMLVGKWIVRSLVVRRLIILR